MTESSNVSRLIGYNDHKNRDIKLKLIHPPCILRAETSRRKEYDDAIKRANEAIDLFEQLGHLPKSQKLAKSSDKNRLRFDFHDRRYQKMLLHNNNRDKITMTGRGNTKLRERDLLALTADRGIKKEHPQKRDSRHDHDVLDAVCEGMELVVCGSDGRVRYEI